ncbi:unnamed protein product [Dovyalis caffra]|uniref:Uncharacterized protein n=1 Tax=Dovyalis caffra TaxID=77055 RepID=A0AAV1QY49_9ROSI|nr:unnamed protein product [Dovyalis caffra]
MEHHQDSQTLLGLVSGDGGGFWWSLCFNPIALRIGNLDDAAAAINGLFISVLQLHLLPKIKALPEMSPGCTAELAQSRFCLGPDTVELRAQMQLWVLKGVRNGIQANAANPLTWQDLRELLLCCDSVMQSMNNDALL